MNYPILYSPVETDFDNNGIGILSDCVSCFVTESANGAFELEMEYPMDGIHFAEIANRALIKAKPDQVREAQLFRVYAKSKPLNGIVRISAEHISYDLSGIPVPVFSADRAQLALQGLKENAVIDCPFDFWTDKETIANFAVPYPTSIRAMLGGVAGSILDVYGGEYEFDNYTVKLHSHRGTNRGVSIRYGKNLTSIKQEENCANVATGIYPYWVSTEAGEVVELPEKLIYAPGEYDFERIITVDFSQTFTEKPTVDQLRSRANQYVVSNQIGIPKVSIKVSFAQLDQSEEYKHLKNLDRVLLFDEVNVEFPLLKVSATARAVELEYNVLQDRVVSVTLGSVRANIADTIANQQQEIQKVPTKSDLKKAQENATNWLTNGKGYKVERRDAAGNTIDTLYMDKPDIDSAVNVLRIGQSGIGFSHTGVNGPYVSAWTIDGGFVADFITTGNLNASLLKSGIIDAALVDVVNLNANNIVAGEINAALVAIKNLSVDAADIKTGTIDAARIPDLTADKITSGQFSGERIDGSTLNIKDGASIAGWDIDDNSIYKSDGSWKDGTFMCTGSGGSYSIGGSEVLNNWVFGAGGKFGVRKNGGVWCSDLHATAGSTIGAWRINSWGALTSSTTDSGGEVSNSVWIEPGRLFYIYNQSAGSGIHTTWENVVKAGNAISAGETTNVSLGNGTVLEFTNGVLTNVTHSA